MLPRQQPDRIQVAFDDHRLVANAGLLLPVTLAHHLGLGELVDRHVDLGRVPGRANGGDKMLTLVASALAGGDCIDDADALRAGGTEQVLGCAVKAPSTLGTFLRSFRWGHARQLDRVSRELLARAWAAGAGPRSLNNHGPLTIDLDSTICETYGPAKEGARRHTYTGQRGYHPLFAVAAGTGDVLMARLRQGRANTARGAAHFLRETIGRVRYAGATGPLTMRADRGFYTHDIVTHDIVAVCRKMKVRFSITIRQHQSLRNLIEAIPEDHWAPIPYWMEGAADVAETTYVPFASEPDAVPVRLIVRRVKPTPNSQLALLVDYSYHGFITDREGETLELEADHRRHRFPSVDSGLAGRSGFRRRVAYWHFRLVADVTEGSRRLGRTSLWNRRRCGCVPGAVRLLDCSLFRPPADASRRTTSNVGWKWLSVKGRCLRCSSLESPDRNSVAVPTWMAIFPNPLMMPCWWAWFCPSGRSSLPHCLQRAPSEARLRPAF